jgi:hypothetical protein
LKKYGFLLAGLNLLGGMSALSLPAQSDPPTGTLLPPAAKTPRLPTRLTQAPTVREFGRLPLSFEPNRGQADRQVRFLTRSADSALSLNSSEAVFTLLSQPPDRHKRTGTLGKVLKTRRTRGKISIATLRMQLIGADPGATTLAQQPMEGRVNYFIGNDSSKWHTDIPTFGKVGFHRVYPGVDVVYYGNQQHLEYDFVVAPHADPKQIQLHFAGAQGVRVNAAGDLVVRTKGRELTWRKPTVYQQNGTGKHAIAARFRLRRLPNGQADVSFALGHYDTARPLVVDPVLLYSSRLQSAYGGGPALAVDSAGSTYVTGTSFVDEFDGKIFVTKLNPPGTGIVYSTYLGFTTLFSPPALTVDGSGNAYITGLRGTNFPVTPGAYNTQTGSSFVTKLNPTGDGLIYSTLFGGTCKSIAVDSGGNAYLTGSAGSGFPTTPGAFQTLSKAPNATNAFVTKLNPTGTALIYSTYLGGSADLTSNSFYSDAARSIAVDSSGSAYVTGGTASSDFPTTSGAFQKANIALNGYYTAFVTKLNPTGTALAYSTFLGGSIQDVGNGIAVDGSGSAYVAGQTSSGNFPTTPGAFQRVGGSNKAFVTKLNPTGTALSYSTYLGGTYGTVYGQLGDGANGIALDSSGNAYVTGRASTTDFPTTAGAFQRAKKPAGYDDAFVTKLNSAGTALIYSTILGGTGIGDLGAGSSGMAIAVDGGGNAYASGSTVSSDFPTTPGAYTAGGGSFVTKLSTIPIFPDFNNDGFTDLFFQNSATGAIVSWFMQGATQVGGASFSLTPPSDYALVGTGDFLGNGATTLLLQSRTTNQLAYWFTGGANLSTILGGQFINTTPNAGWKVVGVGDFNGDGKSDIVFQNQTTGQIAFWFMNGAVYQTGISLNDYPLAGWKVAGVGDFNKDGFPDLVFQNQTTGQIAIWYMNGTTHVGGILLPSVPDTGWKVVGVGDYNGDGSADLLFQNQTSNQAVVWYMQGGVRVGGEMLSLAPLSGWKIVGPR